MAAVVPAIIFMFNARRRRRRMRRRRKKIGGEKDKMRRRKSNVYICQLLTNKNLEKYPTYSATCHYPELCHILHSLNLSAPGT